MLKKKYTSCFLQLPITHTRLPHTHKTSLKDTSLCSLLVHDPVTALSASDWITGLNFIFSVTFYK